MLRLNGKVLIIDRFPNHEARFKDFADKIVAKQNILELIYEDDADLWALYFAKDYLDDFKNVTVILFIWYMPYSRMDRKIEGDLFTLKPTCEFINNLKFQEVYVMEPHSAETMKMLKRSTAVYPINDWISEVQEDVGFTENDFFVLPDKGAVTRYQDKIGYDRIIVIEKVRNPISCSIDDMFLKQGEIRPGSKYIIMDDLCSKGGTALGAAKILKKNGAGAVFVAVSHLEEAALEGDLLKPESPVTRLYAPKSFTSKPHPKVKYVDIDINRYIK